MGLRTTLPAIVAVLATAVAGWLYLDNRRLEAKVAGLHRQEARLAAADPWAGPRADAPPERAGEGGAGRGFLPWRRFRSEPAAPPADAGAPPPEGESRMERRARRTQELERLLGRGADETEDEYRARILPKLQLALTIPRARVDEMRHTAEAAAGVTDQQHQQLDDAFGAIYDEVIDYTDGAIGDGQLTPYGRNVTGMLQYAGGLGAILEGAEGRIGKILSPEQMRAMSDAGFEWGEYLGLQAPWERLRPPPPRPGS